MNKRSVMLILFVTVSLISIPLFANGQNESNVDGKTVINYWNGFTGPDGKYMQAMVDEYNETNTDSIYVKMSVMPWGDYKTKLPISLKSGKGPDVGIVTIENVGSYKTRGLILPLTDLVDQMELDGSDFMEKVWSKSVIDGENYAIPLDVHPTATLFWNKDMFEAAGLDPEAPPTNREEFLDIAQRLTNDFNGNGRNDQWGSMIPVSWPNYFIWFSLIHSNGGTIFNDDLTKATYGNKEGVEAFQFMYDLIYKYKVSPTNVGADDDVDAFKRGKLAMEINGIWMLSNFKDVKDLNFGAVVLPGLGTEKSAAMAGSHTLTIFKKRKQDPIKVEASAKFIKWISDNSIEWAKSGQVPARNSVRNSAEFHDIPYMSKIAEGIDTVVFPDSFAMYDDATGPIWEALNLILLDAKDIGTAVEEAVEISNAILQE